MCGATVDAGPRGDGGGGGDGGVCGCVQAPSAYQGPCSGVLRVDDLSVVGKIDVQRDCAVLWPKAGALLAKSEKVDSGEQRATAFLGTKVGEEVSGRSRRGRDWVPQLGLVVQPRT